MDAHGPEQKPPIPEEEIERAARAIAAEKSLADMGTLLLRTILDWCEPALVACFRRDPESDAGWSRVPELSSKVLPSGIEATFRKLIDEAPRHAFQVPTLIRPLDGIAGITVKPRDNWVVPWTASESASGFLLVRGVARPHPPNLGQAVAAASAPIWTLIGGMGAASGSAEAPPDADVLDRTTEDLARVVERLRSEVAGMGRRVAAAKAEASLVAAAKSEAEEARALAAAREQELAEARDAAEKRLAALEGERDAARNEAAAAKAGADAARDEGAERARKLEELKARVEQLETRLSDETKVRAETEAGLREETARLRTSLEEREAEAGKAREAAADAEQRASAAAAERDSAKAELDALRGRVDELEKQAAAAVAAPPEAEAALREEVERLRAELRGREDELGLAREAIASAEGKLTELRQAKEAAQAERADANSESEALRAGIEAAKRQIAAREQELTDAKGLRTRIEELEQELAGRPESAGAEAQGAEAERLRAAAEEREAELAKARETLAQREADLASLRDAAAALEASSNTALSAAEQKIADLEAARAALEAERDAARGDAEGLRGRLAEAEAAPPGAAAAGSGDAEARFQALSKELDEAKVRSEEAVQAQEEARTALKRVELSLAYKEAELEETRRHASALEQRLSSAGGGRPAEGADLAALAAQLEEAKTQAEGSERQADSLRARLAQAEPALEAARRMAEEASERAAVAERERDEAKASASAARASEKAHGEGLDERTAETVRSALVALRRTPFVPPTLRIAFSGVEDLFPPDRPATSRSGPVPRLLLLDRDVTSLEPVAADLEQLGVDALLAHYPEEIAFFLKTPDARRLSGVVCDVMAFRSDQDLLDLFRAWRRDLPSLTIVLSFQPEIPTESQRVQRVPARTAGSVPRPLTRSAIVEALRKAQADRGGAEGPQGSPRTPPGR
jgi:hypothetical protein